MTSPAYRLINPQANRSFVFKWEAFDLSTRWHYHPEIELIYFIEGKTSSVIGDRHHQFNEGDLVILGANFPHVLQEDAEYSKHNPEVRPFGVIIQFTEDFLGVEFLGKPEMKPLKDMLTNAHQGLCFPKIIADKVSSALLDMRDQSETRKLLSLLNVLATLAETNNFQLLTARDFAFDHPHDECRMLHIKQYVYENFKEQIDIPTIASVANMTETSFCRYFKSRTLKTFTHFLNEVRISHACKLLNSPDLSITDACYSSGFNNLSYFTRQFKSIIKMSPTKYQQWKAKASFAGEAM